MRKLTLLTALVVSMMVFSSTSFADWKKMGVGSGDSNRGDTFYLDFERMRKVDGYVYIWMLIDYLKPTK